MRLRCPKTVPALLRGADHVLVVVPQAAANPRVLKKVLPDHSSLAANLAKATSPGLLGSVSTSLTEKGDLRLSVGVIPDEGSRHNSPARAEAVRTVAAAAGVRSGKFAVLLVVDKPEHVLAAANGIQRALPEFSLKSGADQPLDLAVLAVDRQGRAHPLDDTAQNTMNASRNAARLVDTPPTDLDPAAFVSEARKALRGTGVTFQEFRGNKLLEAKLGGIHAVGRCAKTPPRMLLGKYRPAKAEGPHIALVGKGITYDTGGLNLKGRAGMEGMKGDMGGAAAVLGAFDVLVRGRHSGPVTLVLCLAENAIGPVAYKPDDVLRMHSGKTVEINNTDAEGRIVLADGVSYSARNLKCDIILDAATLTGAQMVATGSMHAAVFSNDEKVEAALVDAGRASGDLTHPLPFAPEFYKSEFRSQIADMRNSVKNRANAQASCAAQFIYWHIEDTPARWGHVDLAGPASQNGRGTGYGVALLAEAVRRLG